MSDVTIDDLNLPIVGFNLQTPSGMSMYRCISVRGNSFFQIGILGGLYFLVEYALTDGGKPTSVVQMNGGYNFGDDVWGILSNQIIGVNGSSPPSRHIFSRCHTSLIEKIINDIVDLAAPEVALFLKLVETIDAMVQQFPIICIDTQDSDADYPTASPLFNVKCPQPSGYANALLAAGDGNTTIFFKVNSFYIINIENMMTAGPFVLPSGLLYIVMTEDYSDPTIYLISSSGVKKITPTASGVDLSYAVGAFEGYLFLDLNGWPALYDYNTGDYYPSLSEDDINAYLESYENDPRFANLPDEIFNASNYGFFVFGQTVFFYYTVNPLSGLTVGFRVSPDLEGGWLFGGFQIFADGGLNSGNQPFFMSSGLSGWATHGTEDGIWRINMIANPLSFVRIPGIAAISGGCRC